ncbi:MAG: ABC transporter substrate-binding protein [Anaerolineaceae bacterium]|nr:ABC transporter substrate-binding protein [Anaerolineaceae bacterium]
MKFNSKMVVVFSFALVLILSACTPVQNVSTEPATLEPGEGETTPNSAPTITDEPSSDVGLEFTDATGKLVSLPDFPQRIIVAGRATPYVLDTLYLFPDATKKLVALEVRGFDTQAFLELVDPTVQVKDMLDRDAGPEQIAPYQPDLVIVKNISLGQLGSALEEISIPVMGLNLETPAFFYEDIRALGSVLDSAERAEEIVAYYQKIETEISELLADLTQAQRPSVLVLQYSEDGGEISFKVPPASYLQTTMVQNAGGNPVWLDADGGTNSWIQVGLEQIAVWNPDIIFVVNYAGDSVETVQELVGSPTWQGLKAVENQQVFGFPADYASWDLIDPRWILGQQWLATIIQPELATGINLETQVISFYQTLYGLSEAQINEFVFPRLDEIK